MLTGLATTETAAFSLSVTLQTSRPGRVGLHVQHGSVGPTARRPALAWFDSVEKSHTFARLALRKTVLGRTAQVMTNHESPHHRRRRSSVALAAGEAGRPMICASVGGSGELDLAPVDRFVGYLLRRAQQRFFDDTTQILLPFGLRPTLFSALNLIDANPGRTQSEVAAALGIQRPNYVAMMDELERRGLARRLPSAVDRRSYAVILTDEGKALLRQAVKAVQAREQVLLQDFTPAEREQMLGLLKRL